MELIRTLTSTLVATLLCFTSIGVDAKVLSCEATKGNGRGWIPRAFRIDLADDRKTAQVISPTTEIFGAKPFEKSFLGSSLWSRGKGRSNMGDYYNYQLRLDLDSNDTEAKIVMKEQGYSDIEVGFKCVAGESKQLVVDDSTTEQTQDTVANAVDNIKGQFHESYDNFGDLQSTLTLDFLAIGFLTLVFFIGIYLALKSKDPIKIN